MATTSFTDNSTLIQASWLNDIDTNGYGGLTSVAGTNTVTATGPASMTAYAVNQVFRFVPAATNTGATTLNITPSGATALGAKNVFWNGVACVGGEITIAVPVIVMYDGTQFQIIGSTSRSSTYTPTLTSGVNIDSSTPRVTGYIRVGNYVQVSGMITIDPTSAALVTFNLSLPVASNLASNFDLGGTTYDFSGSAQGGIIGDATADAAAFQYIATSANSQSVVFTFGYQVK